MPRPPGVKNAAAAVILIPRRCAPGIEANLREQFQPENDEEWAIIKERIQKVSELRRASAGGMRWGQ